MDGFRHVGKIISKIWMVLIWQITDNCQITICQNLSQIYDNVGTKTFLALLKNAEGKKIKVKVDFSLQTIFNILLEKLTIISSKWFQTGYLTAKAKQKVV